MTVLRYRDFLASFCVLLPKLMCENGDYDDDDNSYYYYEAGVKRELILTVKARKLAYCGHTIRKQGSCLEKEIMQGTMPGACR